MISQSAGKELTCAPVSSQVTCSRLWLLTLSKRLERLLGCPANGRIGALGRLAVMSRRSRKIAFQRQGSAEVEVGFKQFRLQADCLFQMRLGLGCMAPKEKGRSQVCLRHRQLRAD